MAIAIALAIIAVASVLFHFWSPWQATPLASNWGAIDLTLTITLLVTGFFFVAITGFMAYAVYRFRHRAGSRAHYEPENKKLEWWLIGLTSIGIAAMLAPGLVVYDKFVHVPEDAYQLEVVGQQWLWRYRFPGADGVLGTADVRHISSDNPLGINPDDPNGQDDILIESNDVHLPIDRAVKFLLRSRDVLHDFYVPHFRAKMDMVPGLVSYFWATPTRLGTFEILCAELCGVGHYNMRGNVIVDTEADFNDWLQQQPTFAQTLARKSSGGLVEQGRQLAQGNGCLACHSVDGSRGLAPTWLDLYGKTETIKDGSQVIVDAAYLKESIVAPAASIVQGYPPVMVAYNFSPEQLDALVAYIQSLRSDVPPASHPDQAGASSDRSPPAAESTDTSKTSTAAASAAADPVAEGRAIATAQGCLACHSLDGSRGVGPSWKGLYGATETLSDGSQVTVDTAYLKESITHPNAKVVEGYAAIMPAYALSDAQLEALIAFTLSLGEATQ
ncbi:MAG: c-type cytochrome [Gammaproteobacteria bacterium]|nr:c-type cytochrome [Gammaproteobacteria bacterium]